MKPFQYLSPRSLSDLYSLLAEHGSRARLLAGGTDLIVRLRHGQWAPDVVIDLKRVADLRHDITSTPEAIRVGALATMMDLSEDRRIRDHLPALAAAARVVGSVQIRNRATLAGNIANASPAADTAPALLAYGAVVNLVSARGARPVPIDRFFLGPGQTVREPGELIASIDLAPARERRGAAFVRITRRRGVDLATISVCCVVAASGETRLAFGAAGPRPMLAVDATGVLAGAEAGGAEQEAALKSLLTQAAPRSDLRGSRAYREAMLLVAARRALRQARDGV